MPLPSVFYPTLEQFYSVDPSVFSAAIQLDFAQAAPNAQDWDQMAYYASTTKHSGYFSFQGTFGATYNFDISSWYDPISLKVYDQYGNALMVDGADDNDQHAYIEDFRAPYTGTFFVHVIWSPTQSFPDVDLMINVDTDTTLPFSPTGPMHINGTDASERVEGTFINDVIDAGAGNDTIDGGVGNDTIHGGDGVDIAVIPGSSALHEITLGSTMLIDRYFSNVLITLDGVERLQFDDKGLAFDIDGNAGLVARVIGAAFGAYGLQNQSYVSIGLSLADGGMSQEQLAGLAAAYVAPQGSNTSFVNTVYLNVMGTSPSTADRAFFTALLDSGEQTRGSLLYLASTTAANASHVDLIGLQDHGLAF